MGYLHGHAETDLIVLGRSDQPHHLFAKPDGVGDVQAFALVGTEGLRLGVFDQRAQEITRREGLRDEQHQVLCVEAGREFTIVNPAHIHLGFIILDVVIVDQVHRA